MSQPISKPSKEQVRTYTEQRRASKAPPPEPEEIRRQLGWHFSDEQYLIDSKDRG
jgi:hypothetical protein